MRCCKCRSARFVECSGNGEMVTDPDTSDLWASSALIWGERLWDPYYQTQRKWPLRGRAPEEQLYIKTLTEYTMLLSDEGFSYLRKRFLFSFFWQKHSSIILLSLYIWVYYSVISSFVVQCTWLKHGGLILEDIRFQTQLLISHNNETPRFTVPF